MTRNVTCIDSRPRSARRPARGARLRPPGLSFRRLRAIVYTWSSCALCARAKDLLAARSITFREVLLDGRSEELRRLQETCGARSLPLVLLDGELVAGLEALETALAGGPLRSRRA